MATRRNVTSNLSEKIPTDEPLRGPPGPSDVSPAVPSSIIAKLIGFTAAMVVLPIGSYFLTVHNLFKGNSTYAGGLAALVANVVLIGYVIVAYYDDQSEQEEEKKLAMGKVE